LAQAYSHTGKKVLANREFELYERFHQQQMAEDERRRKEAGQPIFDVQVNPQAP
jgi:hypothetical protein